MSKEYARDEAIEKAGILIKKLSQRIEELSEITIDNCDNFEIALYLQKHGKEFISLLEEKDIKEELGEYDNETIAMVLGKILPIAIELGLEKELTEDFSIADRLYTANNFEIGNKTKESDKIMNQIQNIQEEMAVAKLRQININCL